MQSEYDKWREWYLENVQMASNQVDANLENSTYKLYLDDKRNEYLQRIAGDLHWLRAVLEIIGDDLSMKNDETRGAQ